MQTREMATVTTTGGTITTMNHITTHTDVHIITTTRVPLVLTQPKDTSQQQHCITETEEATATVDKIDLGGQRRVKNIIIN